MHRRAFLYLAATSVGTLPFSRLVGQEKHPAEWLDATSVSIDWPEGLAIDSAGQLYIAEARVSEVPKLDEHWGRVLVLDTARGKIRSIAGGGNEPVRAGLLSSRAKVTWPTAVAVDGKGRRLWIVDRSLSSVLEVDLNQGTIVRIVGGPQQRGILKNPEAIVVGANGEIYLAETRDRGILQLDPASNRLTRIVGANGLIKIAPQLQFPAGLAVGPSPLLYVADYQNNRIVEFDIARNSARVLLSNIQGPKNLAIYRDTLYFTESLPWVRAIDLRTMGARVVAGSRSTGFSGDGGPATSAKMIAPHGLAVDQVGNLFIADSYGNRIRMVNAKSGVITTVAGNGLPLRQDIKTVPRL